MSFTHATVRDGIPFLLIGLYLSWLAFRPISKVIADDPQRFERYKNRNEYFTFAGPGLTIASAIYMLAKTSM